MGIRSYAATSDPAAVLTKALLRAGDQLGLTRKALGRIIGVSEASMSRLTGGRRIDPDSKEGELALLLLRLFRSLDPLGGGDAGRARSWFEAHNLHLGGIPSEMVATAEGLVDVTQYLDAMRGKL